MAMTPVACNKCGESLHIDQGSPSGLKVVKCPACNYPNLFTLPLKSQGQTQAASAAPARASSHSDAPQSGAGDAVELGPPGASIGLPSPKPPRTPGPQAGGARTPLVGSGRGVDLPAPAKAPRASTARPSDPELPVPVAASDQRQPGSGQPGSRAATNLPAPVSGRPPRQPTDLDLPAPRRGSRNTDPGTLRQSARDQVDLPAPSRPSTQGGGPGIIDLPAPFGIDEDDGLDLLAPTGTDNADLPRPVTRPGIQTGAMQPGELGGPGLGGALDDDDPFGLGAALGSDNPLDESMGTDNPLGDPFGGDNPLDDPLGAGDLLGEPMGAGNLLGEPAGADNPLDDPFGAGSALGDPLGADNLLGDPFGQPSAGGIGASQASSDFFGGIDAPGNLLDQGDSSDFLSGLELGSSPSSQGTQPPAQASRPRRQAKEPAPAQGDSLLDLEMPDGAGGMSLSLADPAEFENAQATTASFDMNALDLGSAESDAVPVALSLADRSEPVATLAPGPAKRARSEGAGSSLDSMDIGLPDLPGVAPAASPAKPAGTAKAAKPAAAAAGGEDFGDLDLPSIPGTPAHAGVQDKKETAKPKGTPEPKVDSLRAKARRLAAAATAEEEAPELTLEQSAVPQITHGIVASHHTRRHELLRRARRRKRILTGLAVVLVVGASAGGFMAYTRWQEQQERQAVIHAGMQEAETHLRAGAPGHWERAGEAAQRVLTVDPVHPEALGIAAEAAYAALLDEGIRADERRARGTSYTEQIDRNVVKGVHVDKAQALKSIDQARPQPAIERLERVLERKPDDAEALLYLGWAHAAASDSGRAAEVFARALAQAPERKLPALYGLAQARLAMNDRAGAREAFQEILALRADHIGAMVGLAQVADVKQSGDREAFYLDILRRDDLDRADPRAVSRAWELAGYQALNGSRIEEAKRRFGRAVDKNPGNIQALIGQAKVALLQDRAEDARTALTTVLRAEPAHIEASLTFADLSLRTEKPDEARAYVDKIIAREETIEDKSSLVRAYLLRGRASEAEEGKEADVIAAYERARELAGKDAIGPAVALAKILTRAGRTEDARAVLRPVHDKAASDPAAATTLGVIYAEANALAEAEEWFRNALALRPDEMDAQLQLGRVLIARKRPDEALSTLQAAFQADPSHVDIGVTLADLLEQRGRTEQADRTFASLLEAGNPGVSVLARAGLFYSRIGKAERAGELGQQILTQQENHAAGLFLRGEGQYHRGEYREALHSYREAVGIDPDARYLHAQGRASERLNLYKEAMDAYTRAAERDPSYLAPRLGQANLLIERREYQKALELLAGARQLDPANPMVHFYTGVCYQAQGDDKRAVESLRASLRYDARYAEAHYRIGRSHFELSELGEAASALARATELATGTEPWLARAYLDLGYVQRSRSKRREAIRAWEKYLERIPKEEADNAEPREVRRLLRGLREQSR